MLDYMKKTILTLSALALLVSCGGAPSIKKDEPGHNPAPEQLTTGDTITAPRECSAPDSLVLTEEGTEVVAEQQAVAGEPSVAAVEE